MTTPRQVTVKDLIAILKKKDASKPVQFIVVGNDGSLVCANLESQAHNIGKMLSLFKRADE